MSGGFQTSVSTQPAAAVAGDFCDVNPRATVDAGPGGLVAGAAGVTIGRFAWWNYQGIDADNAPTVVNSFGAGAPTGFVGREQQALITTYLADSSMVIPQGFQMTLFSAGGFWAKNDGATQILPGDSIYADNGTGKISNAAGSASVTGSIAAKTSTLTGSIAGNVLSVTAASGDPLLPGAILTGTGGGGVTSGTTVVAQLTGTAGGIGTYAVNIPEQTVTSTALSGTYGLMTVTAVGSGTLAVGDVLSGTGGGGVTASTVITALGTGTGLTGTYVVSPSQTVTSTTIAVVTGTLTKFKAMSAALAGEIVKISSHLQG